MWQVPAVFVLVEEKCITSSYFAESRIFYSESTGMRPKELLLKWVDIFNSADPEAIAAMYHENATNHQVANEPVLGRVAILDMFRREFEAAKMVCIVENIFEDGEWAILEWRDPKGFRGCGFFRFQNDLITFQRGYWDKLSFHKLYNLPLS